MYYSAPVSLQRRSQPFDFLRRRLSLCASMLADQASSPSREKTTSGGGGVGGEVERSMDATIHQVGLRDEEVSCKLTYPGRSENGDGYNRVISKVIQE